MGIGQFRVAASCFEPQASQSLAERRAALQEHVSQLLRAVRPDLLVLPEEVISIGIPAAHGRGAEPITGPTVAAMIEMAGAFKANICIPIIEDDGGAWHNTAVYVGRDGQIAGCYRKQVPTPGEIDDGIRPGGAGQPAMVIDGLRVGTSICFDHNFPDQIWHWISAGIDLLVFPAYTFAGDLMRNWAINCGVPLICAFPWESVIYERDGSTLAKAGSLTSTVGLGYHVPWIACTLNLKRRIYHLDENQKRLKELTDRYGSEVDVCLMERDGRMMLTICTDELDWDHIERDLGLVPLQTYLRNSRDMATGQPRGGIENTLEPSPLPKAEAPGP